VGIGNLGRTIIVKVLVTGATSLLARATVERLIARGDSVRCFQRSDVHPSLSGRVEVLLGDIREARAVATAVAGCDAVIHAAAKVGVVGDAADYRAVNVAGTDNVLTAMRQHNVERLVYVSSPSVAHGGESLVGAAADPARTTARGHYYADTKAEAERRVLASSLLNVAVRPHLVWGPGDTQLVGRIVERAKQGRLAIVGSGAALVDSTYIDNAGDALVCALDSLKADAACVGQAYVIANNEPRPIRELLAGICAAAGVKFSPRSVPPGVAMTGGSVVESVWKRTNRNGEPPMTRFLAEQLSTAHWFDPRPARNDLGYQPTVSIDDGFVRLRAWFQEPF
jgi:2-alkyl-3-oxoalkanoate reductase